MAGGHAQRIRPSFQGSGFLIRKPRALPWAAIGRAVGAEDECAVGVEFPRTKGANYRSEGQRLGLLQQMFV
jgi:hypothetical protein